MRLMNGPAEVLSIAAPFLQMPTWLLLSLAKARDGKERISESMDKSRVNITAQNEATNLPYANK